MRRLACLIGCALLVACGGSPTSSTTDVADARLSFGGFTMGSGNRGGGSVTDTTTTSAAGGVTLGSGGRESGTIVTDSTSGVPGALGGIFGGSGN